MSHFFPFIRLRLRAAVVAFPCAVLLTGCTVVPPLTVSPEQAGSSTPPVTSGPPQGTDVWLLDLTRDGGALQAAKPRNLTNRPGYDNQPYFTPAGNLLFVQMEGKTDIWRWSSETERVSRVTATPRQGEYSPTPIPGAVDAISYIRSPTDTDGRLWRLRSQDKEPEIIFPDIGPVGYHAWFDPDHVALWLLRDPSELQLVKLGTQVARTIATGVGRSPQSVPNRRAVSFTRETDRGTVVELFDLDQERTEELALLPEGSEFHTWTPDGVLLTAAESRVFAWRSENWQTVTDLNDLGLRLSRLAVSPDGSRLAVVAEPAG